MIYNSEHISITQLQAKDALQLNKLLVSNTERFIRYLPITLSENRTLESSINYIERKIEAAKKREEFVFVINDKNSRNIIGLIILKNLDWENKQAEFAYCIGNRFKGKGLMSKAIKAASNYAIETLGLETLQIISHKTNSASVNVALQSGFKWKETLENEFTPLNEASLDMELYEFSIYEK
ncbi:GNAT family N-acetyltransferase [Gelidibacter mesophilus]|uniref:GNAT family N-acetyltransferase n=1 Tax=Gelidibacter mesophilus TaxID=169050 RepID=UPI0003F63362|nr:GNAT family N-acetyltransferase [Gelidibacter mesophilus]